MKKLVLAAFTLVMASMLVGAPQTETTNPAEQKEQTKSKPKKEKKPKTPPPK